VGVLNTKEFKHQYINLGSQNYVKHNVNITVMLYLPFINVIIVIFLNMLIFGIVRPRLIYWCLYFVYFRLPEDCALAPKHVGVL
jgi:fatty-acid desaturase